MTLKWFYELCFYLSNHNNCPCYFYKDYRYLPCFYFGLFLWIVCLFLCLVALNHLAVDLFNTISSIFRIHPQVAQIENSIGALWEQNDAYVFLCTFFFQVWTWIGAPWKHPSLCRMPDTLMFPTCPPLQHRIARGTCIFPAVENVNTRN